MTLDDLNSLSQSAFIDQLGWVFEDSPWVAERAYHRRPFAGLDALHAAMRDAVEAASRDEQLELLLTHPDLGAKLQLSAASLSEQTGAGLHQLSEDETGMLRQFNSDYRRKFGFPFIYAVKGSPAHDILMAMQIRLDNTPDEEFHEALYQVYRIAYFRLEQVFDPPDRS